MAIFNTSLKRLSRYLPLPNIQRFISSSSSSSSSLPARGLTSLSSLTTPNKRWQMWEGLMGGKRRCLLAKQGFQVRSVYVEVKDDNFELALNKYGKLMRQDKTLIELGRRQSYMKPSERKVLARKERDRRIAKKEFKEKLKWIMSKRSRGF